MSISKTRKDTMGSREPAAIQGKSISKEMRDNGLLERSKYSLDLINGWIVSADSKISTSCGIVSVAVAALIFVAENALSKIDTTRGAIEPWKTCFIVTGLGVVSTFVMSLLFHFLALSPRFLTGKNSGDQSKKKCNIFYEDIKDYKDAEEYINAVRNMSEGKFVDDVLRESYYNSKICSKKMHRFKIGLWMAFASIVLILICSLCYFLMYHH